MADPESYLEPSRARLLEELGRRVRSERILEAFCTVPRHAFVPPELLPRSYEDRALPIGEGQTISQPSMIAIMLEALDPRPEDRVLEVGAGSGYAAALLSCLAREVHAIELLPGLATRATDVLTRLGFDNVRVYTRDGTRGLPEAAPFDCILVSAGAAHVPDELVRELAPGGRIVIPVGDADEQILRIGRLPEGAPAGSARDVEWTRSVGCVFVPLVGA